MRKYEEALERARAGKPIDEVFPELKESEEEKIRKEIVDFLLDGIWRCEIIDRVRQSQRYSKWVAYLEKRKEQKPAKWNDADDKIQRNLMSLLSCMRGDRIDEATYKKYYPWLRDLPKRFNLQQEPSEIDLEKLTEKIKTFQGRYKHPESISIKGAMTFMARMFYQYPNVARKWYDSLPKATMD